MVQKIKGIIRDYDDNFLTMEVENESSNFITIPINRILCIHHNGFFSGFLKNNEIIFKNLQTSQMDIEIFLRETIDIENMIRGLIK